MPAARTVTVSLLALLVFVGCVPDAGAQVRPVADEETLADLAAGRFWHAARRLRAAGAAEGSPEQVVLLARAEGAWGNWDEVPGLLAGRAWLDDVGGGEGWYLLGRARELEGAWAPADSAYARAAGASGSRYVSNPVLARWAAVRARAGDHAGALELLDRLGSEAQEVRSWAALGAAEALAQAGDTAVLTAYLERISDEDAVGDTWRLAADAYLAAGDTARGLEAFRTLQRTETGRRAGAAAAQAGALLLARGDTAEAKVLLASAVEHGSQADAGSAAGALLDAGLIDEASFVSMARALDAAGDGRRALRAYDRAAAAAPSDLSDPARLARARLIATVPARHEEALEEFRAIRQRTRDESVAVRNLEVWTALRSRQRRQDAVRTLQRWLLEEHPSSGAAAALLWQRGLEAEARGDLDGAVATYATLVENARGDTRATQARMRTGQILLGRGRTAEAAAVYDDYLEEHPGGGRWEEASYWSAVTHLTLGDSARAEARLQRIAVESPLSYYAVVGSELAGRPFRPDLPEGEPPVRPGWLLEGLRRIDDLTAAGLERGAAAEVERLRGRAEGDPAVGLALAEELLARGRTVAGINVGWDLRRAGRGWDRRLLQVVYPFPYREMIVREAEDWGVDPLIVAALIRQESAFKADIVSRAGAIGLMQVMPATGTALARAHGPPGFQVESLRTPEVNVHLGTAFFVEMNERFGGDLPLTLVAYNAGPTRANRWRRYPEAGDALRFAERIPFDETRGYVKNIRRNVAIYRALYGSEGG